VELHTAEDCRIESMQAVSELLVTSTRPIKLQGAIIQLIAAAAGARVCRGLLVLRELLVVAYARSYL
jgi:hypothetical protein